MASPEKRPAVDTSVTETVISRARILVVDDQEDVRGLLVTALELEGHVVDEAPDALRGLRSLQMKRYDLVLSDYAMPGGTGTWMLDEAVRQGLLNGTPALIVTAYPEASELSSRDVVAKPLDLDLFLEQVRRILDRPRLTGRRGTRAIAMRRRARGGRGRSRT
jgi:CheY-like chemotaxis protein